MAMNRALRSGVKLLAASDAALLSRPVSRGLHATGAKQMGVHGHDKPFDYEHAKHMYNLDRMKYQKLKITVYVTASFVIGAGLPVYTVVFHQKRAASS